MTASSHQAPDGAQPPPPADSPPTQAVGMTRSYDGLTVEAIADEVHKQAYAEFRADLRAVVQADTEVGDRQALMFVRDRARAIAALCDGRPLDHLLSVHEVLAALDGSMPTQMPLTIAWDGEITDPDGDGPGEATLVSCTTSRGGPAVLALDSEQRHALGVRLVATVHTAETCTKVGCGATTEELGDFGPIFGRIRVQVAGIDGPSRWWCSPGCVSSALTAAGAELAAIDRTAAATPAAQAPEFPYGDPLAYGPSGIRCGCGKDAHSNLVPCRPDADDAEYLDAQYGPGASDEYALQVAEAHEAGVEDERGYDDDQAEDGGR